MGNKQDKKQMMKYIRKFLLGLTVACTIVCSANCATSNFDVAATDVGDYGSWATENNKNLFLETISDDLDAFYISNENAQNASFVPIEAKLGLSFMNALSYISHVLNHSLNRFIIVFIIAMIGYWLTLEIITIMQGESKIEDKISEFAMKILVVAMWVAVLGEDPSKLFEYIVAPTLFIANIFSDIVLDGAANFIGTEMPDTCAAIHRYVGTNISNDNILNATTASNIMCLPTKMSTFAHSAISAGWDWVKYGIGNSGFVFMCGLGLIFTFLYLLWQFSFMAFGVIADLFLGIIMLPFTAVTETVGKTTYKGIVGNIFNGFVGLFSAESLKTQIQRFINAGLHFAVLSVVIIICITLLSMAVSPNGENMLNQLPDIESVDFWVTLLLCGTIVYLAKNASKFADEIGGKINTEIGDNLKSHTVNLFNGATSSAKSWLKAFRKK